MKMCGLLLAGLIFAGISANGQMVVHEWGTFTTLQDEEGHSIGGINTDDEPLPDFVHRIAADILNSPTEAPPSFFQGAPACDPDVTMRLETPVLYFHPPAGWKPRVNVHVEFRGGWLTEFYPDAIYRASGLDRTNPKRVVSNNKPVTQWRAFGHITSNTVGDLSWNGLKIGTQGPGPKTMEKIWLSPREVDAAAAQTEHGEAEKFLFYRGVGHIDAPLSVVRNNSQGMLEIHNNIHALAMLGATENLRIPAAWLVDVHRDGACAFRTLGVLEFGKDIRATTPASFKDGDYSPDNNTRLRGEMRTELIKKGLNPDEADALLNTWQISYFKSPGMRLFYICPPVEVNGLLPLQVSVPSRINRVMVGRIELVTPEQRALLAKIAAGPAPDLSKMRGDTANSQSDFFKHPENMANWNAVMAGTKPYSALGLPIPELYADYLKLGRFRNALLLDEDKRRTTPALHEFIVKNGFSAYQPESKPN